jgi:hypothetical protein
MTSRKTKADEEGWKRGAGAYSKEVKLNRGSFPNSVPGTDPRGVGKYTSDDSGLTLTKVDPERLTNDAAIDRRSLGPEPGRLKPRHQEPRRAVVMRPARQQSPSAFADHGREEMARVAQRRTLAEEFEASAGAHASSR